jgi:hypothetical protein
MPNRGAAPETPRIRASLLAGRAIRKFVRQTAMGMIRAPFTYSGLTGGSVMLEKIASLVRRSSLRHARKARRHPADIAGFERCSKRRA